MDFFRDERRSLGFAVANLPVAAPQTERKATVSRGAPLGEMAPLSWVGRVQACRPGRRGDCKILWLATPTAVHRLVLAPALRWRWRSPELMDQLVQVQGWVKGGETFQVTALQRLSTAVPGAIAPPQERPARESVPEFPPVSGAMPGSPSGRSKAGPCPVQGTVVVCQKSHCRRRGSDRLRQTLQSTVAAAGWDAQVTVRGGGCLGRCKAGPAIAIKPGKERYTNVREQDVPQLLGQHFGQRV